MSSVTIPPLDPARFALLVIDMQNAFCHPDGTLGASQLDITDCRAVVDPIRSLIPLADRAGIPVVWTVQEHFQEDHRRMRRQLPPHTARRARVSALAGTWDAAIVDELAALAVDPSLVIRKHRFGAFHGTRLELVLDMLGRDGLLVTGVTANACVDTTLREAYLRDYDAVAVSDCIGGVNPAWKRTAEAVWAEYLGIVATSAEVSAWLDGARVPRRPGVGARGRR